MVGYKTHFHLLTHFGLRWLFYRLRYALRLRLGVYKRKTPIGFWEHIEPDAVLNDRRLADQLVYFDYRAQRSTEFFFSTESLQAWGKSLSQWDEKCPSSVATAEGVTKGFFRYFSNREEFMGMPPDWHLNPFTGQRAPEDSHWSELPVFDFGDIKVIWELSRFEFVFALVRAYHRTKNGDYPEIFWQLFENWCSSNPPNQGVNWQCGQEISLRVMAACFGFYGFWEQAATTPQRVQLFLKFCYASGQRIAANIDYAISQKNNHGISEGMGLWTIGVLFPELKCAARWAEKGRNTLEKLGRELIFDDGAFAQHSVNYHRLMLHDYLWVLRLGDILGQPFSSLLKCRLRSAVRFLAELINLGDGRVPNFGQNDGALILPLNNCDYQDYRPVIQAVHYLCENVRCLPTGCWDEDLLWLFGPQALTTQVSQIRQEDFSAAQGGCYTLRTEQSFVFARCAAFKHRPSQADQLHVDFWWKGQNLAIDAGTYSYNAPVPWDNPLASTKYHNTVTVDGTDEMERVGKFLWLPWAIGGVSRETQRLEGGCKYWEGMHSGYHRLKARVTHRRGILNIDDETWLVLDRMETTGEHAYRLHWLLADFLYEPFWETGKLRLNTQYGSYWLHLGASTSEQQYSIERADPQGPRGWRAPYYCHREPALSVDMHMAGSSVVMWSLFHPSEALIVSKDSKLEVRTERNCYLIMLGARPAESLLQSIESKRKDR